MKRKNIKRAIAISGVIGGMICLKPMTTYATENSEILPNENQVGNVNSRISSKGQVINVDGTYLRIRSIPSTESEVLGTMAEGMKFDIISKTDGWYKINYNNTTGYVYGDYVQEINSTSTESILYYGKVYNADPNLRVRSGSSLNSSIIGYVVDDTTVSIVGVENEWFRIKYNGAYGYVHKDYILVNGMDSGNNSENENNNDSSSGGDETIRQTGYVYDLNGASLRVRQSPNTSSTVLGNLYEGNSVNIVGEEGNWYRISYNDSVAYVSKEYVTLSKPSYPDDNSNDSNESNKPSDSIISKGRVINVEGSNLRVRQSASADSFAIGYLLNNATIDILAQEGNWYKILFRDSIGYVSSDYISIDGGNEDNGTTEDSSSSEEAFNTILNAMKAHLGSPYVWGGAGEELTSSLLNDLKNRFPADAAAGEYDHAEGFVDKGYLAFDCSGFMQWAFKQAGIYIGRTTYNQINDGVEVSLDAVQPGDLLFTDDLGHVGMYIGNDQWIESSFTGDTVRIRNVPWGYIGRARRILK